ncbi:ATP-binding cassette domain-containing protein [Komagataeibacter oboediens]|nr:ATP-binding cassette domain-containing protein [Komagataeibacter oboediens]MCK9820372.1 ATP-binding cassette domain-containing protein [Komagataeibacter oboediens]
MVGPSGCGKSTLLRLVAGLDHPDEGTIQFGSHDGDSCTPDDLRRQGALGMAFQDAALLPWRDVRANMALPLELIGHDGPQARERMESLLALVGLQNFGGALAGGAAGWHAPARRIGPGACDASAYPSS